MNQSDGIKWFKQYLTLAGTQFTYNEVNNFVNLVKSLYLMSKWFVYTSVDNFVPRSRKKKLREFFHMKFCIKFTAHLQTLYLQQKKFPVCFSATKFFLALLQLCTPAQLAVFLKNSS